MKIEIGNKFIGDKYSCFIIAEAGVNHNGDIKLAKRLIDVAKSAGVDAVKFQTFKSEELVTETAHMADYQEKNIKGKESQLRMLKKLELNYADFTKLKEYCDKKDIIFLSTPHTENAVDFLESLVPAYKIASGDLTNLPFLEKIAEKEKPIILSTGMGKMSEVREAIITINKKTKGCKIMLLHCTTNYPCPLSEVNLRAMNTLKKEFKDLVVGYSDHTEGVLVSLMAVALGAKVLEKHFTLDKNMCGPDHKASLNPQELKDMVDKIRIMEIALGSEVKEPTISEKKISKIARKSIVAKVDIPEGKKISESMLIIKRPGTGIQPRYFKKIIGMQAKKEIKKDSLIDFKDLK